jgi:HK97 family phage prohead protease
MTDKIQYRTLTIDARNADSDKRTVKATLSSEQPVERFFGLEVLSHAPGAVNLERAVDGLPLLFSHNTEDPVGRAENIRVKDRKLKADLRFSKSTRGSEIWQDVADGVLKDVSIGYRIDDSEEAGDTSTAIHWTLLEASIVTVPADHTVGINRSFEMDKKTKSTDDDNVIPHERWLKQEQNRRTDIRQAFTRFADDYSDLMDTCLDDPHCKPVQASERLLRAIGDASPGPLGGGYTQSSNGGFLSQRDMQDVGANRYGNYTARDTLGEFADAATDGILQRGGIKIEKPHPGAVDVRNMRVSDVAETILRQFGDRTSGMSRDQIIRKALSTRGLISHSSSDFPSLLENVASKALLQGFTETPAVYRQFCRIGSLPDFKQGSRTALSDFSDLEVVYENGEYKYGTFSDLKETIQLSTYGKMFSISRQALVNDDLGAFISAPRGMAASASRTVDDLAVNVIINNAALNQDSTALFHANHSNLETSGGAPSVTVPWMLVSWPWLHRQDHRGLFSTCSRASFWCQAH